MTVMIPTTQQERRRRERRRGLLARMPTELWLAYLLGVADTELRDAIYEDYDANRRSIKPPSPELAQLLAGFVGTRAGVYMRSALDLDQHLEAIGRR